MSMKSRDLEKWSFWWSEVRLVVAAIALLIGGVPPVYLLAPPSLFGITRLGLVICWIISGIASGYLLYRWYDGGQKLFGKKDPKDTVSFLILAISGLNLGFAGVFGRNLGMTIASGRLVFAVVAIIYLLAAWQLWNHAQKHGGKLF